jgi:hypothetical protein
MGNAKSKEIEVTTKFYGENPTDDANQTFGREQLPKFHKCHIKELRLNQTNKYDMNSYWHYAIWSCKKN